MIIHNSTEVLTTGLVIPSMHYNYTGSCIYPMVVNKLIIDSRTKLPVYKTLNFSKTKNFIIPGIDFLSRIWRNFLEFWILNALQFCTCLAL